MTISPSSYDPRTSCHICHSHINTSDTNLFQPRFQRPFHPHCLASWKKSTPNSPDEPTARIKRVFTQAKDPFAPAICSKDPITHKPKLQTADLCTEKLESLINRIDSLYCVLTHDLFPVDATNTSQRETLYLLLIGLKYGLSIYSELMMQKSLPNDPAQHRARINYYFDLYDDLQELALYFIAFENETAHLGCKIQKPSLTIQKDELNIDQLILRILRTKINNQTGSTLNVMLTQQEVENEVRSVTNNPELRAALIKEYREIGTITLPSWSSTDRLNSLLLINQALLIFKAKLIHATVRCMLGPIGQKPQDRPNPAKKIPQTTIDSLYTNTEEAFRRICITECKNQSQLIHCINCNRLSLKVWKEAIEKSKIRQKITLLEPNHSDICAFDKVVELIDHCLECLDFAESFVSNPTYRQHTIEKREALQIIQSFEKLCSNNQTKECDYAKLVTSNKAYFDNPKPCTLLVRNLMLLAQKKEYTKQNLFTLFHFLSKNITSLDFFSEDYARLLFVEYQLAVENQELLTIHPTYDTLRPLKALCDALHVRCSIFIHCMFNNKRYYEKERIEELQACSLQLLSYYTSYDGRCYKEWLQEQPSHPTQDQLRYIELLKGTIYAFINALSERAALCFMGTVTHSNYSERDIKAALGPSQHPGTNLNEVIAEWLLVIENSVTAEQLQTHLKKMCVILTSLLKDPTHTLYSEPLLTVKNAITGALQFFELAPLCSSPPPSTAVRFFEIYWQHPIDELTHKLKTQLLPTSLAAEISAFKNSIKSPVARDFSAHIILTRSSLSKCLFAPSLKERIQNHETVYSVLTRILDYSDAVDNFYHLKLYYTLLQEYLATIQQFPNQITDAHLARFEVIYFEFYITLIYSRHKQALQNYIESYITRFEADLGALELEICKIYRSFATSASSQNIDKMTYYVMMVFTHLNSPFLRFLQSHQPNMLFSGLIQGHWFCSNALDPATLTGIYDYAAQLIKNTIGTLTNQEDHKEFFNNQKATLTSHTFCLHYTALLNCSKGLIQRIPPLPQQTNRLQSLPTPLLSPKQFFFYLRDFAQITYANKFTMTPYDFSHIQELLEETFDQPNFYTDLLSSSLKNIFTINDLPVRFELLNIIFQLSKFPDAHNANYRSLLLTMLTDLSNLNKIAQNSNATKTMLSNRCAYYYPLYYYISSFIKHHPSLFKPSDRASFLEKKEEFKSTFSSLASITVCQAAEQFFSEIIRTCFSLQKEHMLPQVIDSNNTPLDPSSSYLLSTSEILQGAHNSDNAITILQCGILSAPPCAITPILSSTLDFFKNTAHQLPTELALPEDALRAVVERVKDVFPGNQTKDFTAAVISTIAAEFDNPRFIQKIITLLAKNSTLTRQQLQNVIIFIHTHLNVKSLWRTPDYIHFLSVVCSEQLDLKDEKKQTVAILFLHMALYAINHPQEFSASQDCIKQSAMTVHNSLRQTVAPKILAFHETLLHNLARICYCQARLAQTTADMSLPQALANTKNLNSYLDQLTAKINLINHKNTFTDILNKTISFLTKPAESEPYLNIYIAHCEVALAFCRTFEQTVPFTSKSHLTSLPQQKSTTASPTPPAVVIPKHSPEQLALIQAKTEAKKRRKEQDDAAQKKTREDIAATNQLREQKRNGLLNLVLPANPNDVVVFTQRITPAYLLTTPQERHEQRKVQSAIDRASLPEAHPQTLLQFIQDKAYKAAKTAAIPAQLTTNVAVIQSDAPLAIAPNTNTTDSIASDVVTKAQFTPLPWLPAIPLPVHAEAVLKTFTGDAFISGGYPAAHILNFQPNDIDIIYRGDIEEFARFASTHDFKQNKKVNNLFTRWGKAGELDIDVYCLPKDTVFIEALNQKDISLTALLVNEEGKICDPLGVIGDFDLPHLRFLGDLPERMSADPIKLLRLVHYSLYKPLTVEQKNSITQIAPQLLPVVKDSKTFGALRKQLQVLFLRGNALWYFDRYFDLFKYLLPFSDKVFGDKYILYCKLYMKYIFEEFDFHCKDKALRDSFRDQLLAILILPEILPSKKTPDQIISALFKELSIEDIQKPAVARLSYHREQYLFMLANLNQTHSQRLLIQQLAQQPSQTAQLTKARQKLDELEIEYSNWRKGLAETIREWVQPSTVIYSATSAAAII